MQVASASSIAASSRTAPNPGAAAVCRPLRVTSKTPLRVSSPAITPRAIACDKPMPASAAPPISAGEHGTRRQYSSGPITSRVTNNTASGSTKGAIGVPNNQGAASMPMVQAMAAKENSRCSASPIHGSQPATKW